MDKKYLFETEVCSRCGGTGNYSYCSYYGTTCFKCRGAKVVLTKRGAAAQKFLTELQTVSLQDLKPGMIIEQTGISNGGSPYSYKATVTSVEPSDSVTHFSSLQNGVMVAGTAKYIHIKTTHPKYGNAGQHVFDTSTFRVWPNSAVNIEKALAYQASLTKTGTVRKNKK